MRFTCTFSLSSQSPLPQSPPLLTQPLTSFSSTAATHQLQTTPAAAAGMATSVQNTCHQSPPPHLQGPELPIWTLLFIKSLMRPLEFSIPLSHTLFLLSPAPNSFASTSTRISTPTSTLLNLFSLSLLMTSLYSPISVLFSSPSILKKFVS